MRVIVAVVAALGLLLTGACGPVEPQGCGYDVIETEAVYDVHGDLVIGGGYDVIEAC